MDFLASLDFWLWAAAVVAALFYLMAFFMKVLQPAEKTGAMMPWVKESSRGFVTFVGLVDLAGGLGLILPLATGILPFLTPLAALGTVVLQILAIIFHGRRGETSQTLGLNIVLLALGAFVLWGRRGLLGL
jgi:uncharacterized membrane protein